MDNLLQVFQNTENVNMLMYLASFLGGILTSVSPCSLALLPIIVGYIGGYSKDSTARVALQALFFVLGLSFVFSIIGLICALTGKVLGSFSTEYFTLIIASILLIMGLKLVNILDFEFPVIVKQIPKGNSHSLIYAFLLGMLIAFAGSPCSTPILASIMAFASYTENMTAAVLMLFLFSLGQGLILFLAAIFTSGLKKMKQFAGISDMLMKLCGLLLVLASIYLFYKIFHQFL